MATAYVFTLDGHTFERDEVPARGPVEEFAPQRWSKQDVLGTADPGTIMTFLGTRSQAWPFSATFDEVSKDKLKAVLAAKVPVVFQTPQNGTGFSVILTDLRIEHRFPAEAGKWLCSFNLTKR